MPPTPRTGAGDVRCTCTTIGPHGHDPACPAPEAAEWAPEAAEWAAECAEFGCYATDDQPPG